MVVNSYVVSSSPGSSSYQDGQLRSGRMYPTVLAAVEKRRTEVTRIDDANGRAKANLANFRNLSDRRGNLRLIYYK